ncbi:hypothetical protein CSC2_35960 [Clostridium zeae]|uniref:CXXX repeat peptide modification system protein n=1 Tax=Clostridium zeae TaxID=2759022 RepID=A0ABQ1EE28_9CLOT|nr:CXXX repeat peptide modification system protein [Clostridium zeae]GFZ33070.1 hypothetical protein CSC2_35960 [Clostridium zeae]
MFKEKVGYVTDEEKKEILRLYERRIALNELLPALTNMSLPEEEVEHVYEKIIHDVVKTKEQFDNWWADTAKKYQWKSVENGNWTINFDTNEIILNFA